MITALRALTSVRAPLLRNGQRHSFVDKRVKPTALYLTSNPFPDTVETAMTSKSSSLYSVLTNALKYVSTNLRSIRSVLSTCSRLLKDQTWLPLTSSSSTLVHRNLQLSPTSLVSILLENQNNPRPLVLEYFPISESYTMNETLFGMLMPLKS